MCLCCKHHYLFLLRLPTLLSVTWMVYTSCHQESSHWWKGVVIEWCSLRLRIIPSYSILISVRPSSLLSFSILIPSLISVIIPVLIPTLPCPHSLTTLSSFPQLCQCTGQGRIWWGLQGRVQRPSEHSKWRIFQLTTFLTHTCSHTPTHTCTTHTHTGSSSKNF